MRRSARRARGSAAGRRFPVRPAPGLVSTLTIRVLTCCADGSSLARSRSTDRSHRGRHRPPGRPGREAVAPGRLLDQPPEQLVAEEAAAKRQPQAGWPSSADALQQARRFGPGDRTAARGGSSPILSGTPRSRRRARIDPLRGGGLGPSVAPRRPAACTRSATGRHAAPPGRAPSPPRSSAWWLRRTRGPRSDRLVRPALPVDQVVAALVARPAPVGDLVAAPARRVQEFGRQPVLVRGPIFVLLPAGLALASAGHLARWAGDRRLPS